MQHTADSVSNNWSWSRSWKQVLCAYRLGERPIEKTGITKKVFFNTCLINWDKWNLWGTELLSLFTIIINRSFGLSSGASPNYFWVGAKVLSVSVYCDLFNHFTVAHISEWCIETHLYLCSSEVFPRGLPEEFTLILTVALKKAALRDTAYLFQISDQQGYPQVQLALLSPLPHRLPYPLSHHHPFPVLFPPSFCCLFLDTSPFVWSVFCLLILLVSPFPFA